MRPDNEYLKAIVQFFADEGIAADKTGDVRYLEQWRNQFPKLIDEINKMIEQATDLRTAFNIELLINVAIRTAMMLVASVSGYTKEEIDALFSEDYSAKGQKSGEVRRHAAEVGWRAKALELMKKSRENNPKGTLDDLADYVEDNWIGGDCRSRSSLRQLASKSINEGKLAKKS